MTKTYQELDASHGFLSLPIMLGLHLAQQLAAGTPPGGELPRQAPARATPSPPPRPPAPRRGPSSFVQPKNQRCSPAGEKAPPEKNAAKKIGRALGRGAAGDAVAGSGVSGAGAPEKKPAEKQSAASGCGGDKCS